MVSASKPGKSDRLRGKRGANRRGKRREQGDVVMDLFLALILCHNVTPVYSDPDPADNQNEL